MQASELKGRAVVALSNAQRIGHVDDVLFDARYRQVLGFQVKGGGLFARAEALPRDNVSAIGADALTVPSPDAVNDQDRFPGLAHAATLGDVQGTKVVTESGDLLGTIAHLEIDDDARRVLAYELATSLVQRVLRHEALIQADEVVRLGEDGIMVVPDAVGARLHSHHE
jgi:uncharacterized protein YrrD